MSSEFGVGDVAGPSSTTDDSAYQPVSYNVAFPPLPCDVGPSGPQSCWTPGRTVALRSTNVTQVFTVPLEERRYTNDTEHGFGDDQAKICQDIMQKTGISIEISSAKDRSLTVVLTGKQDVVMKARKMVVQQLQTQAKVQLSIPKEHHKFLLGPKGKKLTDLELATATKISLPRTDDKNDVITIVGSKDGVDRARHEIQLISDEQAKRAFERLPVPKIYHPFICGPDNQDLRALCEKTGAKISIPPASVMKDEIAVSGEKEGVQEAVAAIWKIYEEKKRKCVVVSVEVRKSQHKYVIGPKGSGLSEILAVTGVSVDVPPHDSNSETISLRGEQDKLGPALTMVYSKANSVIIQEVEAPAWLHRYIIGQKGVTVRKITQELPKVHIEFTDGSDKILLEGPPEEVQLAQTMISDITKDLLNKMSFRELHIDARWHRHIIGRKGINIMRIKEETGVSIKIPSPDEAQGVIRIEGSPEGVEQAAQELQEMVNKMENEKVREIAIEHRFHRNMIGAKGAEIKKIKEKFPSVQITFPDVNRSSDTVAIRGPQNEVDKCFKYLQQVAQDMATNNYQAEVHIFKDFHKNIIGKGGATIKKIRDETETRIDLPPENSDSDVITITGKKNNVEQAKNKIEAMQKELANIKEVTLEIPHKFHNSIIGSKGRLIRAIMEECGGVLIRFPSENSTSDKVVIRGPVDDVEKARKQLIELANERKESSFIKEIRCKPEYHKFLIGRGGTNIRKVRDSTGARIVFPASGDEDQELITIIGKQEAVQEAETELAVLIKDLDNVVEGEVEVDPKHHRHFVARRGEVLRLIADDFGGVAVSFPRSGVKSSKVVLKGAKDCVEGAKKRILEIVDDLEQQVTIECIIPQKYHRTVMGARGHKVKEITQLYDVGIKFPDRPVENNSNNTNNTNGSSDELPTVNGDVTPPADAPRKGDIIIITGHREKCDQASEALLALVPITDEVVIRFGLHRYIIGQKGKDVRKLMEDHDVNISIPPAELESDVIKVMGTPANVEAAKEALLERVKQLEEDEEDRVLRSFKVDVEVDSKHHPKIIGRRGATITKIRTDHDVKIQLAEKGAESENVISITGYERNVIAARDAILDIIKELEDMITEEVSIDRRIHARLIGERGRSIRRIMEDFKVEVRFPRADDNPDVVSITGLEDNVADCREYMLNVQEEFLQDIIEREQLKQYMQAPSRSDETGHKPTTASSEGFVVRGAPWSNAPDTNSTSDFPEFGATQATTPANPVRWGPRR